MDRVMARQAVSDKDTHATSELEGYCAGQYVVRLLDGSGHAVAKSLVVNR